MEILNGILKEELNRLKSLKNNYEHELNKLLKGSLVKKEIKGCHLKIKSEPFLLDLKFKSELFCSYNLEPIIKEEKGFKLWNSCIRSLLVTR